MDKLTTFAVNQAAGAKLRELAKKYNTSSKDFAQKMIDYFYHTGHDPEDFKHEGSTDALKRLEKKMKDMDRHIISFIKTQEKDMLIPAIERIELSTKLLKEFLGNGATEDHIGQLAGNQKLLRDILIDAYPHLRSKYTKSKS